MSILRQIIQGTAKRILPICYVTQSNNCAYHIFNKHQEHQPPYKPNLLEPYNVNVNQICGFKVKGKLRRRCKDCYFVVRQQRLYVICKTHPRHKQMSMVKDEKNTWILTHATQGKVRPW